MPDVQETSAPIFTPQGMKNPRVATERALGDFLWAPIANHTPTKRKPHPYAVWPDDRRFSHVAKRLRERSNLSVTDGTLAKIEQKIRWCQARLERKESYSPILPQRLRWKKTPTLRRHYWRVLINGTPVVLIVDRPTMRIISVERPPKPSIRAA